MSEVDNKPRYIAQDNFITSARYNLTATQKNILYMVMDQMKMNDDDKKTYYVSAQELMDKTGMELQYAQFKKSTEQMIGKVYSIKRPNGNDLQVGLLSSAEYIKGQGMIEINLDAKIKPFFYQLKSGFTTFQLDVALSLKSKYSKRLYEMLSQFKDLGTWTVKLKELKDRLSLIDRETGQEKYSRWNAFESRVLLTAQKELAGETDVSFEYTILKRGKRIESVVFTINEKSPQLGFEFDKPRNETLYEKLIEKYKLRPDQALEILEKFGEAQINKMLYTVQINKPNNIGAYTAKVFGL